MPTTCTSTRHDRTVDRRPLLPVGGAVADFGPGAGTMTVRLAERVAPAGRVYAVDNDETTLGLVPNGRELIQGAHAAA